MITFCVLLLVVVGGAYFGSENSIEPGLLAIAITYCIQLSGVFQYMIRLSARVEVMMTSVERLDYYCNLKSEETLNSSHADWHATKGEIELKSLCVKYREDLPTILRDIDVNIPSGSKVGVIGRTGSGKSSLILALCRLNLISKGKILIDGKDTSCMSLDALRGSIGIIPQKPVLFTGSLRENVDPTLTFSDQDILEALRSVHLSTFLDERGGLDMEIHERGRNLSVGQRQLVSLARALLLKRRIYVVDEATANIDMETDKLIQTMIRSHPVFRSATILTIAHRISTISDSDMLIVLDSGRVAEIGSPKTLISTPGSIYGGMVRSSERSGSDVIIS
jgi:ABC-type multidrug transport system fused ATPase/permease subunit